MELTRALEVAIKAADLSRAVILGAFGGTGVVYTKHDSSPVTDTDRTAERVIRESILGAFPEHGFIGEELGTVRPEA
jgi:fructose-1,6-bisphosphatase/inositol monophosphatase family enzyme